MYRGKGFLLNVIGNEALLATYCQLKTHFLPLSIENGLPMADHWLPNWYQIGHHSQLSGSIDKGPYYFYFFSKIT